MVDESGLGDADPMGPKPIEHEPLIVGVLGEVAGAERHAAKWYAEGERRTGVGRECAFRTAARGTVAPVFVSSWTNAVRRRSGRCFSAETMRASTSVGSSTHNSR